MQAVRQTQEMEAEIQRLRAELRQTKRPVFRLPDFSGGASMVWVALGVCGAALAFAILAVLNHG